MPCNPEVLKQVPLFALLDDDEVAVLAARVELKTFATRQRIYKMGDPGGRGYVLVSGGVRVTTVDQDHQEVIVDEPGPGEFFGFASMLEQTHHHTEAIATEEAVCVEVDRDDILILLQRKPHAGMDMLAVLGRQFHSSQQLVRIRANRHPNEVIEEEAIIMFGLFICIYTGINITLRRTAWDPYPFILLNLFLSMLAAIQAPVIMMSQNRTDKKDRLRGELDYDVNRRAHSEILGLAHKLNLLGDRLGDIEDLLRAKV